MHGITLVCSVHRENGACNADQLLNILRSIEPDVVFQESRSSEYDFHFKHGSLEDDAIKKYRDFRSFELVPVDRFDNSEISDIERQNFFAYVERSSQEYRELMQVEDDNVRHHGFGYLNNIICEKLTAKLNEIEDKLILGSGDQDLIRGLQQWRSLTQNREREMVRNIYEYSRSNAFDSGVFIVGAAHKTSIIKEIKKYTVIEAGLVNWSFSFGQTAPQ